VIRYNDENITRAVSTVQWLKMEAADREFREDGIVPFPKGVDGFNKWAFEMNELIEARHEDSYVAVVHIDGNGMGRQLRRKLQEAGKPYAEAVPEMRRLSKYIAETYRKTFQDVIREIAAIKKEEQNDRKILPVRPLIMDGDDLTFVCKGSWGVPITARLLKELERASASPEAGGLSLTACAGVALVHSHFPFHIAYEVSEGCCRRAKRERAAAGEQGSYLDFRVVRGSNPQEEDESIQYRPYRIRAAMPIDPDSDLSVWTSYRDFTFLVGCIKQLAAKKWPRSRVERLYALYRGKRDLFDIYLDECRTRGYELSDLYIAKVKDEETKPMLFDALELSDYCDLSLLHGADGESGAGKGASGEQTGLEAAR
jgi:hypothetical protein